jgi:hypothetical protein
MTTTAPAWTFERPWRNQSPGDVRICAAPDKWVGQTGVDHAPGGPYAIFASRTLGWRAAAACLLTYHEVHHLNTIDGFIDRWAPPSENNTEAYKRLVCAQLGISRTEVIDPRREPVMLALLSAIALAEGSARIQWPEAEKIAGARLALGLTKTLQEPS